MFRAIVPYGTIVKSGVDNPVYTLFHVEQRGLDKVVDKLLETESTHYSTLSKKPNCVENKRKNRKLCITYMPVDILVIANILANANIFSMKSAFLSIFANPIRIRIVTCLLQGPKNVSGLVGICGLSQSAVSQHLSKLKELGIITCNKQGRVCEYSLTRKDVGEISEKIAHLLN